MSGLKYKLAKLGTSTIFIVIVNCMVYALFKSYGVNLSEISKSAILGANVWGFTVTMIYLNGGFNS